MSWLEVQTLALLMLLGAMSPGPDFVLVVRSALGSGRRSGITCGLGIASGVAVWAAAAAVGVAGLLAASHTAFTVVKLAGAAYLAYLGLRALHNAATGQAGHLDVDGSAPTLTARAAYAQGLLTNLANPKTAVFYVALLPQYLPRDVTATSALELCAIASAVAVLWFTTLSLAVGTLRRWLLADKVRRTVDAVTGAILVALGVRVATES